MKELLLGCGFSRQKLLGQPGHELAFKDLTTCDRNLKCQPDVVTDLNFHLWQGRAFTEKGKACLLNGHFTQSYFDEIHAYEILEHLGQQGDATSFFSTFDNIHRMLVSGGFLFATVPSRYSPWVWGDPSHRRVIYQESLAFLSQDIIARNRETGTAMSDFSELWKNDFKIVASTDNHERHFFCLQKLPL